MSAPRWYGQAEIEEALDPVELLESQRRAFVALEDGTGQLAERLLLPNPADGSTAFCYAARLSPSTGPVCKFGSVNPANSATGLPSVSATVLVLDPMTGRPVAVLDGEPLTTARTSAASVLAAGELARAGSDSLAVLGSGVQAAAHVRAMVPALGLRRVLLWGRTPSRARALAEELTAELDVDVRVAPTPRAAVQAASVVVTATTSAEPVLEAGWLASGATVITVGSFAPDRCEVGPDVLRAADVVVADHPPIALAQSGALLRAADAEAMHAGDVQSLGAVLLGRASGRRSDEDVVVYVSVGLGIQDAAAAWLVVDRSTVQP